GTNVDGETAETFNPPAFTIPGTYDINVAITDVCEVTVSTAIKRFIVVDDPTLTIGGPTSVCLNGTATLTATIIGGTGTMTPQWQSSPTGNAPWTNIPGATGLTFQPDSDVGGTFYYRAFLDPNTAPCNNSSAVVNFTVTPANTVGTAS